MDQTQTQTQTTPERRPDDAERPSVCNTDGSTDPVAEALRRQAETLAAIQDTVARMAAPPPTPESDRIPLEKLIEEYGDWMAGRKTRGEVRGETKHVRLTRDKLHAWRMAGDWVRFGQINDVSAEAAMRRISANRKGREGHKRIGPQTERHWWQALLSFCAWVSKRYKLGVSPLHGYEKPTVSPEDVRHKRRRLTWAELGRLIEATEIAEPLQTVPGPDRSVLYFVAAITGYRKKELASLTPESFELRDGYLYVSLAGQYAKNRRAAVQLIGKKHMQRVLDWLQGKPAGRLLWPVSGEVPGGVERNTAEDMIGVDLARCGLPYKDLLGRYADFHSLRSAFVSLLLERNIQPNVVQKLARHSDLHLTMNVYDRLVDPQVEEAADAIPDLPVYRRPEPEEPEPPRLRLIGTE